MQDKRAGSSRRLSYNDPNIFSIGDVTRGPRPFNGNRLHRIESVHKATEQTKIAAAVILRN
jgi:3-phenylpropionate/trans-cinnamate dioxygenase ferredoxin reductase subunit